ncbi:hypothetical protein Peur_070616 [Populus x canadensis]
MNSEGLDEWRQFFEGANRTMFEVISNAITVAAKGHPEGFKLKRGEIVQTVYSSLFSLHCRHDHNDLITRPDKAERESFKVNLKMEVSKVIRMEMRLIWQKMVVRRLAIIRRIQIKHLSHHYETFVMLYMKGADASNAKNRSQLTKEVSMPFKEDKHHVMRQGYVPI